MKSLSLVFLYYFTSLLFLFIQYLIYNQEVCFSIKLINKAFSLVFILFNYLLSMIEGFLAGLSSIILTILSLSKEIIKNSTNKALYWTNKLLIIALFTIIGYWKKALSIIFSFKSYLINIIKTRRWRLTYYSM